LRRRNRLGNLTNVGGTSGLEAPKLRKAGLLPRIGFATYHSAPALTLDDQVLLAPLRTRGIEVIPFDWQDPTGLPTGLDAIVLRSCWNYHIERPAFEAWLRMLMDQRVPVMNPPGVASWNLHKGYLQELAAQGACVPTTCFVKAGENIQLATLLETLGVDEAVVKPAVSATAYRTWRTSRMLAPSQQVEFAALSAERDVLVQAFVPEVLETGEVSLVFIAGVFSHAIRKLPKQDDFRVQQDFGGSRQAFTPSLGLIESARAVVKLVKTPLLYARVDGIEVGDELVLMELEVIDPELYFQLAPAGAERFAEAIATMLTAGASGGPCAI
jgi:hypothetical protein